jgi:carbonic anhydrase/acetyltransferase-like protein (isoleucine patch superfamily)
MASDDKREAVLQPKVNDSVFVAQGAHIYGDVEIGEGSSVWFNVVVLSEKAKIVTLWQY